MEYDPRALQAQLNNLGFGPLAVDGLVGPRTDAAVIAFKRSIGFNPRPLIGPLTIAALFGKAPDSAVPWMAEAIRMKGLHERRDTSKLKAWFDKSVAWIDPREIPWCGAFVATVMRKWEPGVALPANPLGARNWGAFGQSVAPQLGAVMTFSRPGSSWSGHVGFYWGEDDAAYHILGGNQSDAVTITRVAKDRNLAARWPLDAPAPGKIIRLSRGGLPLSANEA